MEFHAKILPDRKFEPVGTEDFKKSLKLKPGDFVKIEKWQERNLEHHKKFFAFLNTVIYFLPEDSRYDQLRNIDYLRKELMVLIGEVDFRFTMTGEKCIEVRSISFKSMDQEKFERIYNLCLQAALKHYLVDISLEDFEAYIINYL
jgi:hypothetical protein